ncbi:ABC transporter permease [Chloroflexota bacterium]
MRNYIIRRLLLVIPTLFLVSIIIFLAIRLIPGDIVDLLLENVEATALYTEEQVEELVNEIEEMIGIDKPIYVQYGVWIGNLILHGDLGASFWKHNTVMELILSRLPVTFELGLLGLILSQLIALPIGVFSALRQDTWGDYLARSFGILCIAIPSFWLATMVIVFGSIYVGWSPPILIVPFSEDPIANLNIYLLPALLLGMAVSGSTMRMTRAMMLEVLRQDYIRTAWAKGLRERVVVIRHAMKNAFIPVVTIIGARLSMLVGGTVIIEKIFALPGMGRLLLDAVDDRDYPIVSGVMLFLGFFLVFSNFIVDLLYAYLDPRIHYK